MRNFHFGGRVEQFRIQMQRAAETAGAVTKPHIRLALGEVGRHRVEIAVTIYILDRQRDRLEQRGSEYRQALRAGFLAEAAKSPEHIVVIDAGRDVNTVQQELRALALARGVA